MTTPTTHQTRASRVAIIDDEPGISDVIRRGLQRQYDVDVFQSAQEVFSSLEMGVHYDAILCDLYMPEYSGRQIYDEIKTRWPDQADRVIFMSGATMGSNHHGLLEDLERPMLRKPFRLRDLRQTVQEMVDQS